jgi:hypothetical protein
MSVSRLLFFLAIYEISPKIYHTVIDANTKAAIESNLNPSMKIASIALIYPTIRQ